MTTIETMNFMPSQFPSTLAQRISSLGSRRSRRSRRCGGYHRPHICIGVCESRVWYHCTAASLGRKQLPLVSQAWGGRNVQGIQLVIGVRHDRVQMRLCISGGARRRNDSPSDSDIGWMAIVVLSGSTKTTAVVIRFFQWFFVGALDSK